MRALTLTLAALIVLIQYPLWLGKGSWLRVWEVDHQISEQRENNRRLQARNQALEAEVRDLKVGQEALEERAVPTTFEIDWMRTSEGSISTVTLAGDIYVTGTTGFDAFVARYSRSGALRWFSQFGTGTTDSPTGIVVDSSGVYVAGMPARSPTPAEAPIAALAR